MKLISWNVSGIRSVYIKGFVEWLNKEDPEILCLQEIKSDEIPSSGDLFSSGLEDTYNLVINPAQKKGYSGVAVYSKFPPIKINKLLGFKKFDEEGRFLELKFKDFTLVNLYIPHGGRDKSKLDYKLEVYEKLIKELKKKRNKKLIIRVVLLTIDNGRLTMVYRLLSMVIEGHYNKTALTVCQRGIRGVLEFDIRKSLVSAT